MKTAKIENGKTDESGLLASPALSLDPNDQIKWFIQLRWIAVLVATVLVVLSVDVLEILPSASVAATRWIVSKTSRSAALLSGDPGDTRLLSKYDLNPADFRA